VSLTQAGADLINGGGNLPKVEVTVTDPLNATGTDSADVTVTTAVGDIPTLNPIHDINVLNEGATVISTGSRDVVVNQYDMGAGVSQANLEAELGLPAGSLDNRFDPTGVNVNDPGYVDIIDGKTTEANYDMTSGMTVSWNYTFKNGEDTQSEVANGYNDQVILVVTDPNGVKSYIMVDSSENKFPNATISDSYSFTATMDGQYTFDWLVLNAGDAWKDSSLSLSNANFVVDGVAYSAPIALTALASAASLNDTDGSETLSVTISGIPSGAILTNGTDNHDGSWTLTSDQLANLYILPPDNYTGTLDLTVTATATEISNGSTASVSENFSITVSETSSTVTTGSETADTLHGTGQNDLIRGYAGDDTITGGNGNDMIFGGAGNDTIDGEKGSDALYGGVGNDTIVFDAADSVIDGGAGTDTLILLSGTNIDFSVLDSSKISNIETISLSQNGDHTLTNLSYADVINMTDSNHTLTILGDSANDKVQLTQADGWSNSGTVTEAGHTFDVYTSTGASATDPTVTVKVETVITDTVI
jgi:Ca2+-binding RTX toxin-like protein